MTDATPDAVLLLRYVDEGDEAAFRELVHRYVGIVFQAARRQLSTGSAEAEDVAQSVFTLLARKAPTLVHHAAIAGWLHVTTRHVVHDVERARRRRQLREQEAMQMNEPATSGAPEIDWEHVRPLIDAALASLGERDRAAVWLRYFAGLSFAVVGDRLGFAENAARMRTERALEKIRHRLARDGVTSSAAALGLVLATQPGYAMAPGLAASVANSALATTGSTTAAALGLASIMSMMKSAAGLTGLVLLLGAFGTAAYELQARAKAQSALDDARAGYEIAARGLRQAELQLQAANHAGISNVAPSASSTAINAGSSGMGSGAAIGTAAGPWNPVQEGQAFLARHPEVRQALIEEQRAKLRFDYAHLFARLKFSPAQIEQFLDVMVPSNQFNFPYGPNGQPLVLSAGDQIAPSDFGSSLKSVLGEQGMRLWPYFQRDQAARSAVVDVARDLAFSPTPLTAEQAHALEKVLAAQRDLNQTGTIDWNAATDKAQAVLSPDQLPALEAVVAERRTWSAPVPSAKSSSSPNS